MPRRKTGRIKRAEAIAFRERGRFLNAFELEELQRTPPETKLRQFLTLLGWAHRFGWKVHTPEEIEAVRERWLRLKEIERVRRKAP